MPGKKIINKRCFEIDSGYIAMLKEDGLLLDERDYYKGIVENGKGCTACLWHNGTKCTKEN